MRTELVIVGTGGMGREAAAWAADAGANVVGFLDDNQNTAGTTVAGLPVLGPTTIPLQKGWEIVVAIGRPEIRGRITSDLRDGAVRLGRVVHPSALVGPGVTVGVGSIVGPNAVLTRDIDIGLSVIVNFASVVGHDCDIGSASFIGPNVSIAGNVTIGRGVEVGIGATVVPGINIGDYATIGAGAVVIDDVPARETVAGVPAEPL